MDRSWPLDLPGALRVADATGPSGRQLRPALAAANAAQGGLFPALRFRDVAPVVLTEFLLPPGPPAEPPADLVLCEFGPMILAMEMGLWEPVAGTLGEALEAMDHVLTPIAAMMQGAARDNAKVVTASPGGPVFLARAEAAADPPRDPAALLDWARQNPGRFLYGHPAYTAGGRAFVSVLPYLLGDRDPMDPADGWNRTWPYLLELSRHGGFHPLRQLDLLAELAEDGAALVATTLGNDLAGLAGGLLPPGTRRFTFERSRWLPTGQFLCVPHGHGRERLALLGRLIAGMLSLSVQALLTGQPEMWPGPARVGVHFTMLTPEAQEVQRRFLRPGTLELVARHSPVLPLLAEPMRDMLRIWDVLIAPRGTPGR